MDEDFEAEMNVNNLEEDEFDEEGLDDLELDDDGGFIDDEDDFEE